jgi:hypothetical protein
MWVVSRRQSAPPSRKARIPCWVVGRIEVLSAIRIRTPPFGNLQFALAELKFEEAAFGRVAGRLIFGDDYLALKGTIIYRNPFTVRFQGVSATPGTIEQGRPWIYD